jgi:hypothetical protein
VAVLNDSFIKYGGSTRSNTPVSVHVSKPNLSARENNVCSILGSQNAPDYRFSHINIRRMGIRSDRVHRTPLLHRIRSRRTPWFKVKRREISERGRRRWRPVSLRFASDRDRRSKKSTTTASIPRTCSMHAMCGAQQRAQGTRGAHAGSPARCASSLALPTGWPPRRRPVNCVVPLTPAGHVTSTNSSVLTPSCPE